MTFHADMPHELYHASDAISKSGLDHVAKSIAHYLEYKSTPYNTKSMATGRAVHQLLLEGRDAFYSTFAIPAIDQNDWRRKAGKEWKAEVENQGLIPIHRKHAADIKKIAKAVLEHPRAKVVLESVGHRESSFFWHDDIYDVDCRCRPDLLTEDLILVDLKTTNDASPKSFTNAISRYRYDVQWEFYSMGIEAEFGERPQKFIIIAVETSPPFAVAVYDVQPEWRTRAERLIEADLSRFAEWQNNKDIFTGYSLEIEPIYCPAWA